MLASRAQNLLGSRQLFWLSIFVTFIFFAPYHHKLNNPNEGVRVFMVKAMVDYGHFHIDPVVKQWKYINDKSKRDGKLYSSKAPLMSMMGAAVYGLYRIWGPPMNERALTLFCRLWANAIPCMLLLLLLGWLLDRTTNDRRLNDFIILSLATGTHLLAYVHVFSGHTLAALCAGVMLVLLLSGEAKSGWRAGGLMGLCGAGAVAAEYPAFLVVAPLSLGFLYHQKGRRLPALGGLFLGILPVALVAGWAHHEMFGAFWKTGYSYLENQNFNRMHSKDFFGIGLPRPKVLGQALFSTDVGLFFFSPLALLGLWTLARWFRTSAQRANALFITVAVLGMLYFISAHRGWRGGWVIGPRYISELTAMLVILAGFLLHELNAFRKGESKLLTAALALQIVGLLHSGIGSAFFPHFSETYVNPVYEMMVPMALQGYSPNSWALDFGLPPRAAAWLGLGVLLLPMILWLQRNLVFWGRRPAVVCALTLWAALLVGPLLPKTSPRDFGLETRKMMRIWEPSEGRPIDLPAPNTGNLASEIALGKNKAGLKSLRAQCSKDEEK